MRNFIKILAVVISIAGSTLLAQEACDLQGLKFDLSRLQESYRSMPRSKETMAQLKTLNENYHLALWIYKIPSLNGASPSPERLARINEIADAISPYNHMLVDLAFRGRITDDSAYAVNLLWYSKGGGDLKQELLQVADRNSMAYRMLFNLGLFDQDARAKFCQGLSSNSSIRRDRAAMASDWGLVEALPIYQEMLAEPFDPNSISFIGGVPAMDNKGLLADYKVAGNGVMHLGPKAAGLLPLIKKRMLEIQQAFPNYYRMLTGNLQAALDVLEGRSPQSWEVAMNGRGTINLVDGPEPKWGGDPSRLSSMSRSQHNQDGSAPQFSETISKLKVLSESKGAGLLIAVIILLAAILIAAGLFLMRRNRH